MKSKQNTFRFLSYISKCWKLLSLVIIRIPGSAQYCKGPNLWGLWNFLVNWWNRCPVSYFFLSDKKLWFLLISTLIYLFWFNLKLKFHFEIIDQINSSFFYYGIKSSWFLKTLNESCVKLFKLLAWYLKKNWYELVFNRQNTLEHFRHVFFLYI